MTHDMKENRRKSQDKIDSGEYDVFLSYNQKDQEYVVKISEWLKDNGLAPWLDISDLRPGFLWQPLVEEQIQKIKAAAVFVGESGLGSWQRVEMYAFLNAFVQRECPVIPVLLENAPHKPKLPPFLSNMTWVDFREADLRRNGIDPLERLIYGISGKHPAKVYRPGVLVASLGESPVVVSSMYDLLTAREGLTIDRVKVLRPELEEAKLGYALIAKTFPDQFELGEDAFHFEDANSWHNACAFLQKLYWQLDSYQSLGDSVYLSLAGGRKSMAALMAWVVPFFSCVKGLYHVIDKAKDEKHFLSAYSIMERSTAQHAQLMRPNIDELELVKIPFESGQKISKTFLSQLNTFQPEDLQGDVEQAEALIIGQTVLQKSDILEISITELARKQFNKLYEHNSIDMRALRNGLMAMGRLETLLNQQEDAGTYRPKDSKRNPVNLHYFTGLPVPIRPVFYTLPSDVYGETKEPVERVVICSLEEEAANGGYRTLKGIAGSTDFSLRFLAVGLEALPVSPSPVDSILLVPLGKSPMVATQLYTLLKAREQRIIHEVVLIYPEDEEIVRGAEIIKKAFDEQGVLCKTVPLGGLRDIINEKDCVVYQSRLEKEIGRIKQQYPKYKIDLALSGGRKGMTAMTIFAAQKEKIPYVYHTLITNNAISEQIDQETSIAQLNKSGMRGQERDDMLFLQKYRAEEQYPYEYFTLFKVPVFGPDGW